MDYVDATNINLTFTHWPKIQDQIIWSTLSFQSTGTINLSTPAFFASSPFMMAPAAKDLLLAHMIRS